MSCAHLGSINMISKMTGRADDGPRSVHIFHNLLWPKYKGAVLSELHALSCKAGVSLRVSHIASTSGDRMKLSEVDRSYHRYDFEVLFEGPYEAVPVWRRTVALVQRAAGTSADFVVIPGYDRLEYWAMLLTLSIRRKKRGVFCDSTSFDRPRNAAKGLLKSLFFSQCDSVLAYGARSKEYVTSLGVPVEKVFDGCQAAALPHDYSPEQAVSRRKHAAGGRESPIILYVGRLSEEKGIEDLLHAFVKVRESFPKAELRLIGDGPQKADIVRLAKQLGIDPGRTVLGSRVSSELFEEYSRASVTVLPSHSEPWGLVVNEALSYGCPVVATSVCGCVPELVQDGLTGYVVPPRDPVRLADGIVKAIRQFKDVDAAAERMVLFMDRYSAANAARRMLDGIIGMTTGASR